MPTQVPYEGAPTLTPRFEPTPTVGVAANPAAFGVNIAQATEHLGEISQTAGKEIFDRAFAMQDLTNEASAREASIRATQEQAQIHARFNAAEGANAGADALTKYGNDLEEVRKRNAEGLNPAAARMYHAETSANQNRLYFSGAAHSADELKKYNLDTINADKATADNLVQGMPHDKATVDAAYAKNRAGAILKAHTHGSSPDVTAADITAADNQTSLARINGFYERHDAAGAQAAFDEAKAKGRLTGAAADQAAQIVERGNIIYGSHDLAKKVYDPNKSLTENLKAGAAASDKVSTDVRFGDAVQSKIRTDYATDQAAQTDEMRRATSTIDMAISDISKGGGPPKTFDDLMQDPKVREALKVVQGNETRAGQSILEIELKMRQALANDNTITDARNNNFLRLVGMTHDSPDTFIATDMSKQDLTANQRKELVSRQRDVAVNGSFEDKAVARTIEGMKYWLKDNGLSKADDEAAYNQFKGALQQEFDFARAHGKVITDKDGDTIAKKLLQQHVLERGWIYDKKGYNYQVPADAAKDIRAKNPGATDDQVQHEWLRQLYEIGINKPIGTPQ